MYLIKDGKLFYDEVECVVKTDNRYSSGMPTIEITTKLTGARMGVATVNLPGDYALLKRCHGENAIFIKGWSENIGIPKLLDELGVVKLLTDTCPCGYADANIAILKEKS